MWRSLLTVILAVVVLGACTTGVGDSNDPGSSDAATPTTSTTRPPPVIQALSQNLALLPDQCFADLDLLEPTDDGTGLEADSSESSGTDTTAEGATSDENTEAEGAATETTEPTVPETLPETTTIPRPPIVAVVDCAGTNLGQAYATFCLGSAAGPAPAADNTSDSATQGATQSPVENASNELISVPCPGAPDFDYPGDRVIRRAAARLCLDIFEDLFAEDYGVSARVAGEFTPTEGVWETGDRRVVCHSSEG